MRPDLLGLPIRQQGRDPLAQLGARDVRRVRLEDARQLGHLLAERPVPGRLPVGPAAPPQEQALPLQPWLQLADETALADPGWSDDGHQMRPPIRADLFPDRSKEL